MLIIAIPIIIILAGLVILFFIILRKLPQLSNLDVDNLPEEKEFRKKKEIISRRIEIEGARIKENWAKRLKPLVRLWAKFQLKFRIYVGKVERLWHHEQRIKIKKQAVNVEDNEEKLANIIREGEGELENGHLDRAEELFIAAIKVDPKSAPAYRGLADTYLAQGSEGEAEETYNFLLQLNPKDDNVMVKLADMAERKGDIEKAITFYQQAVVVNDSLSPRFYHLAELLLRVKEPDVAKEAIMQAIELEPKNPKYLDLLIETVIICGDKDLAAEAYNELRLVNPDNQKLADFQDRINMLETTRNGK